LKNKNVLLTGATGFIGKWLLSQLLSLKANVSIVVRNREGFYADRTDSKKLIVFSADIKDYDDISRIIKNGKFDFIFHLASKNINYGHKFNLLETFDTNIKGTYNILDACRLHGKESLRIILTSSREVFEDNKFKHSSPSNGFHPYAVSKKSADLIVKSFSHNIGLNILTIRPPNIYGGGDLNWDRIIPGTFNSIIKEESPIIRTDGSLLRSYLFIEDFVDALILLAKKGLRKDIRNCIYDIEGLKLYSTLEIVDKIINISGKRIIKPTINNISKDEKFNIEPKVENSIRDLGWSPSCHIDEGLMATFEWYTNYFNNNSFNV